MQSQLIKGVAPAPRDEELDAFITQVEESPWSGGIARFRIAIKNASGDVYRTIALEEIHAMIRLTQGIPDFGFVNEIGPYDGTRDGFDAIFKPVP